ncbi:MAG: threonine--tRNA ligase [Actinomycetota bacterium]|nr:threonine--tRNA ligase [Actinomycetota bacterium]
MQFELPDGSRKELPDGATGADLAAAIGAGLARAALAVKIDGAEIRDLARPLPDGARVDIITPRSEESLELLRHDTAHVLATAVLDLYPGTKISIGPPIEDGFYYDFEFPAGVTVSEHDFEAIEARMREHIKADEAFTREDVAPAAALERFRAEDQPYKVELIEDLAAAANGDLETVSLYTNGPFTDLCRGPHAPSTKRIKAFKLLSTAGAYWRGDASRTMLTRIYGTAFHSKEDLAEHLERLEQARARDHRKLGRELKLFTFSEASPGSAFWLPRGTTLFNTLVAMSREMTLEHGYTEVKTPLLYDAELWKTSGHWGKYREHMFVTQAEEKPMGVKPMNCPGHAHLFGLQRWSYRDLPVRYSEPGLLHRNEPSGTLHGLMRVRHFIQDDAHIFCTEEQIQAEVTACLDFAFETYRIFGFEPTLELSTRPEQRIGTDEMWDRAEGALEAALHAHALGHQVNEGDGAFYGPKIDLHMTDSLNRSWQLGTVQLDYSMPERFGLTYTGADNAEHRPVMIHRALVGSFERFIGILIEHYAGEFPLWLAPLQALVLPVADRHNEYGEGVAGQLREGGLRAQLDDRSESVGRKIREAELQKVPYMLVVGDRDVEGGTAALRRHGEGDLGTVGVGEAVERLAGEAAERR